MERRKVADRDDAERCLEGVRRSGLSLREWAREHGVDGRSLNAWRVTLERASRRYSTQAVEMVELVPVAIPTDQGALYVVRVGALSVEVDRRFEDATLARLLRVVASC